MHVSMEENGPLTAQVKIKIEEADYLEEVEQKLREHRRTLTLPGFRPGKVPAGMVNRMMKKPVLSRAVLDKVNDSLLNHIRDNKLRILGQPLPVGDEDRDFDWDNDKEFEFQFDIGLAPEIEPKLENLPKKTFYRVMPDDASVGEFISNYQRELGSLVEKDSIENENDLISASFQELLPDGEVNMDTKTLTSKFTLRQIKDEETKFLLMGLEVDAYTKINPEKATGSLKSVPYLIGADSQDDLNFSADYHILVERVQGLELMPLGEELYQRVFPDQNITDEAVFRDAVKEKLTTLFDPESKRLFFAQCRKAILDEIEVPLPEDFLKRWMTREKEEEKEPTDLNEEMPKILEATRWQILEGAIAEKYQLDIAEEEIKAFFIQDMKQRVGLPEEAISPDMQARLDEMAEGFLKEGQYVEEVASQILTAKMSELFYQQIPSEKQEVSLDEFKEIVKNLNTTAS